MIRSYILHALRSLRKNRVSSFINIAGLSVGMAVAMVIGLWIYDELSFDRYHSNFSTIAQVMVRETVNGNMHTNGVVALPMEAAMRKNYGNDMQQIVLSSWNDLHILTSKEKNISSRGVFISSGAPDMLSLRMISGSRSALTDRSSLLLSEGVARALFGDGDAVGKTLQLDNKTPFTVAGVYADLPLNTTFRDVAFMAPWESFVSGRDPKDSNDNSVLMYVQTAKMAVMSERIKNLKRDNVGSKFKPEVYLYPMSEWHSGAMEKVWLFGWIGFFVLLLACINFMNLSTARSEKRAKEVGIRKAIGGLRENLVMQFLIESLLFSLLAFAVAVLLAWATLPYFNTLSGKEMMMLWSSPLFWIAGLGFAVLTGLMAGSYPAFYLSAFQPVKVLKGIFKAGRFAAVPRRVLVVLQFTVSVSLIIGTLVVLRQIQYAKDRSVGYSRANLIEVPIKTS